MVQPGEPLRRVNLTEAWNLSPLFDEAVRHEHPVLIVRNRREWGLLLSRDAMMRMLESYRFHVDVVPEEGGSFTLWLDELNVGSHGPNRARRAGTSCPPCAPTSATTSTSSICTDTSRIGRVWSHTTCG